jgi:hypothetical protein
MVTVLRLAGILLVPMIGVGLFVALLAGFVLLNDTALPPTLSNCLRSLNISSSYLN